MFACLSIKQCGPLLCDIRGAPSCAADGVRAAAVQDSAPLTSQSKGPHCLFDKQWNMRCMWVERLEWERERGEP